MTIHWQSLDKGGKITAIQSVWRDGMSAAQIAAHFSGATRNSIVGMYDRWRGDLAQHPLRQPTVQIDVVRTPRVPRTRAKPTKTVHKLFKAQPSFTATEHHLAGVPMPMLGIRQCKFAVNDAEVGETHLFCGLPADGSFCGHHRGRVFRSTAST